MVLGSMCSITALHGGCWCDADCCACARRCPQESGALFLYRKVEKVPEPVLLAAPPVKVTEEEAEEFIKTFNETLESVDPETIAKAAAPAEGEEATGTSSYTVGIFDLTGLLGPPESG